MDNFFQIPGYNPLRFNPQMPLAQIGQGQNNFAPNYIDPYQKQSQASYTMHPSFQFGLNYGHMAMSSALQGAGAFLRNNNLRKDFYDYNKVQQNPLSQLPENPNNSQQALYGERTYKSGGPTYGKKPKMDTGGPGPGYGSDRLVGLVDRVNQVLASGNPSRNIPGEYGQDERSLLQQAYLWKQQNIGKSPEQVIQGYYNRPYGTNSADNLRGTLSQIGYGPSAMYRSSPEQASQQRQGSDTGTSNKSVPTLQFDEGGRFDNFDDFDEDDFEDLKDELDRYFKDKGNVQPEVKAEEQKSQEQKEEQPQGDDSERGPREAMAFLSQQQEDYPEENNQPDDEHDQSILDQLAGKAPISPAIYSQKPSADLDAFKKGIANVENAGYGEGNKNSTAFGKYQFTAPTREAVRSQYFPDIKKADFENTYKSDPQFQERVMDVYGNHLLHQFGDPHKAALAFYLGPGKANYTDRPDYNPGGGNVSVGKYLSTFDKGYQKRQGGYTTSPDHMSLDLGLPTYKQEYEDGGPGPQDGKKPIPVSNPNDPRLLKYQDSLSLYNWSTDNKVNKGWNVTMQDELQKRKQQYPNWKFNDPSNGREVPDMYLWDANKNQDNDHRIYDALYPKPKQPYFYQGQQTKQPIAVDDPNDPRLQRYNDSLSLYNSLSESTNFLKKSSTTPETWQKKIDQFKGSPASKAYSRLMDYNKDDEMATHVSGTRIFPGYESDPAHSMISNKPTQPYYYEDSLKRSSVQSPGSLRQPYNSIQGSPMTEGPLAGGKTPFSFTGRDQSGQQTTRYFNDLGTLQSAANTLGYSHMETTNNDKEGHATGIGNQFKEGGEYELTDIQIKQLRKQGYKIDLI